MLPGQSVAEDEQVTDPCTVADDDDQLEGPKQR